MKKAYAIKKFGDQFRLYYINSDNRVSTLLTFGSYSDALWFLKDCIDTIDLLSFDSLCALAYARRIEGVQ